MKENLLNNVEDDLFAWLRKNVLDKVDASIGTIILKSQEMTETQLCTSTILNWIPNGRQKFLANFQKNSKIDEPKDSEFDILKTFLKRVNNEQFKLFDQKKNLFQVTRIFEEKIQEITLEVKNQYLKKQKISKRQIELETFLKEIINVLSINDPNLLKKILTNIDLNFLSTYEKLRDCSPIKNKLKQILTETKTFRRLQEYGGFDFEYQTQHLKLRLIEELPFTQAVNQEVFEALLKNPSSNIVANHLDITDHQKNVYYNSNLYKSSSLRSYYFILNYPESQIYKINCQIEHIIAIIEEETNFNKEMFIQLQNFDLQKLFQNKKLSQYLNKILTFIQGNCPNYFQAYRKIKYFNINPQNFKINQEVKQIFEIRDFFLKIQIPFIHWTQLEDSIFHENYEIFDELPLMAKQKLLLWKYIEQEMNPYFDEKANRISLKDAAEEEIELKFIKQPINIPYTEYKFYINQFLEHYYIKNSQSLSIPLRDKIQSIVAGCEQFQLYKKHQKIDLANQKLKTKRYLLSQILKINFQNEVQIKYVNIFNAIELFLEHPAFQTIKSVKNYICDMQKLHLVYCESQKIQQYVRIFNFLQENSKKDEQSLNIEQIFSCIGEQRIMNESINYEEKRIQLMTQRQEIVSQFMYTYEKYFPQSTLYLILKSIKDQKQKAQFAETILQRNPYDNSNIQYGDFTKILNSVKIKKINAECFTNLQIKEKVRQFLQKMTDINNSLEQCNISLSERLTEKSLNNQSIFIQLKNQRDQLVFQFNELYKRQDILKNSFCGELLSKFKQDQKRLEFAQQVLDANPFEKQNVKVKLIEQPFWNKKLSIQCKKQDIKRVVAHILARYQIVTEKMQRR